MKKLNSTLMMLAMMFVALSFTACSSGDDDGEVYGGKAQDGTIEGFRKTLFGRWELTSWNRNSSSTNSETYFDNNSIFQFNSDGTYYAYSDDRGWVWKGKWSITKYSSYKSGYDIHDASVVILSLDEISDSYFGKQYDYYKQLYDYYKRTISNFERNNPFLSYDEFKREMETSMIGAQVELDIEVLFQDNLKMNGMFTIKKDGKRNKTFNSSEWRRM